MRMIDADALREAVKQKGTASELIWCVAEIDRAPTIEAEPVRHGRWVKDGDFLICLNCESEIDVKNSLGVENRKEYCPNCGLKMDGGGKQ